MNWLHCVTARPDARHVLVCFPHAGGSASFFRSWDQSLPEYELHLVQYPGRADRINEPVPTDIHVMVREMLDDFSPLRGRSIVLFGHSMGAIVAFEIARLLIARNESVTHLFVSGARAAHDPDYAPVGAAQRDDESILRSLAKLGGTHAELLDDPMLRELVMPYVRADFVMFEDYEYHPGPMLGCPVTAVNGEADTHVTDARVAMWQQLTSGPFDQQVLPGNHFYLLSHPPFELIRQGLRESSPAQRGPG